MTKPSDTSRAVQRRMGEIQEKYNFNPSRGAEQVRTRPELREVFAEFKALVGLCKKMGFEIAYNPDGVTQSQVVVSEPCAYLYFLQVAGTTTWKVGKTIHPDQRKGQLQVAHDQRLGLMHLVRQPSESAAFALERRVKHHLRSQKTRDKNRRRGEWFDVEPADVLSLVEKLRAGDESVLADR